MVWSLPDHCRELFVFNIIIWLNTLVPTYTFLSRDCHKSRVQKTFSQVRITNAFCIVKHPRCGRSTWTAFWEYKCIVGNFCSEIYVALGKMYVRDLHKCQNYGYLYINNEILGLSMSHIFFMKTKEHIHHNWCITTLISKHLLLKIIWKSYNSRYDIPWSLWLKCKCAWLGSRSKLNRL